MRLFTYKSCLLLLIFSLSQLIQLQCQWTQISIPTTDEIRSIHLVNATSWFAATSGTVWRTTDAGVTWTGLPIVDAGGAPLPMQVNEIHFTSANNGFAIGLYNNGATEAILRTQNGGTNWTVVHSSTAGSTPREFFDMDFQTTSDGAVVGRNGRILSTTNGGTTWTAASNVPSVDFYSIDYGSSGGFLAGNGVWAEQGYVGGIIDYFLTPDTTWNCVLRTSSIECRVLGDGDFRMVTSPQSIQQIGNLPDIRKAVITSTNHTVYLADRVWVRRGNFNTVTVQTSLPDIRFNDVETLSGVTLIVGENGAMYRLTNFGDQPPQLDGHLAELIAIPSYTCPGVATSTARIFNTGQDSIISATVQWFIDGVQQPTGFITDTIAPGTSKVVDVATISNFSIDDHLIEAFLSDVNGEQDLYGENDTDRYQWTSTLMSGVYTVGSTGADFFALQNAFSALRLSGTCDSVIFELSDGSFLMNDVLNTFRAIAEDAIIRVRSASGNAAAVVITSVGNDISDINNLFFENVTLTSTTTNVLNFLGRCNNVYFDHCIINGAGTGSTGLINSSVGTCGDFYFYNCQFNGGANAINLSGTALDPFGDVVVRDCQFTEVTVLNIRVSYAQRVEITGVNIVSSSTSSGSRGIELTFIGEDYTIENCRIQMRGSEGIRLSDTGTSGGTGRVVNNRIIMGATGIASGNGIRLDETYGLLLAHNTVTTHGTSGGSALILYVGNNSVNWGVKVHNNIFASYTGVNVGLFEKASLVNFTNMGLAYQTFFAQCSGNVWHTSATAGINYFQQVLTDIDDWRAMVEIDSTSQRFNPEINLVDDILLWGNKNFLLDAMVPMHPEVVLDRFGNPRSSFTEPGCDEVQLPASDLRIINTANYPSLCAGDNELVYRVSYIGTTALQGFSYQVTVNGTPTEYTYSIPVQSGDTVVVVVPMMGVIAGNPYTVTMEVSTLDGTDDGVVGNNGVTETFQVAGLAGWYQVGGEDPDFVSIASAISSLSAGICGDVIFELQPGIYTEAISIPANSFTGADRTITIRGAGNDPTQVVWQANTTSTLNYVCQLNGIDYLTIENLTMGTIGTGISLDILVVQNGSNYNTLRNIRFIGKTTSRALVSTNASKDEFNVVENCYFHRGGTSIVWQANATGERENRFSANHFFDQRMNMSVSNQIGLVFEDNLIESDTATTGAATLGLLFRGQVMRNRVLGNFVSGITVSGTITGDGGSCIAANNEIILFGDGSGSCLTSDCDNLYILHNSMHNQKIPGGVAFSALSRSNMVVVGNVFVSEFGTSVVNMQLDDHFRDYNIFWCVGESIQPGTSGDLTSIQSYGHDEHSRYQHPLFTSLTDLRTPSDALLDGFVVNLPGSNLLTVDRLGVQRNFPLDAGCYEYSVPLVPNNATIVGSSLTWDMCPGSHPLEVTVENSGNNPIQSLDFSWRLNGSAWQNIILPVAISPMGSSEVSLANLSWLGGEEYDIEVRLNGVNGVPDTDTTGNRWIRNNLRTRFSGEIYVGPGNDLETPFEMALRLREQGMCGPTEVIIASGGYTDFLYLDEIEGSSSVNTLTIRSETRDYHDVIINNGGNDAVQFDDSAVWLEGTDNVLFEGLTLATPGWNHLDFSVDGIGASHNITFRNCFLNEGLDFSEVAVSDFTMDSCKVTNKRMSLGVSSSNVLIRRSSFNSDRCVTIVNANNLVFDKNTLLHNGFTDQNYDGLNIVNASGTVRITNNLLNGRFYHGFKLSLYCNENNPALVANNVITGNHEFYSLRLDNGENVDIVHNTVQNTEINPVPFYTYYYGIGLTGDNIRVLNNSVVLNEYYQSGFFGISGVNNLIDYNNFYGNLPVEIYPQILADRQAQGYDLNTTVIDPQFFSPNVLIPQNPLILNTGTAFPSVTHDIMGRERNVTSPTIGAYETSDLLPVNVDSLTKDLQLLGLVNDTLVIGSNVLSVEVINSNTFIPELQDVNFGGVVDTIYFTYKVNHRPVVTELWTGSLESGDTLTYVFNTPVDITKGMLYDIETTVTLGSRFEEFDFENNQIEDRILMPMAGEYLVDSVETADFLSLYEAQESRYYCGGNGVDTIFLQLAPGQHLGGMWQSPLVGISNDYPTIVESTTGVREDVWVHFNDAYEVGHITFRNIVLTPVAPADFSPNFGGSIKFTTCGDIHFDNVLFTGPAYTNFYTGLELVACYHTTISNCEFRQLRNGVDWSSTENYGLNYFYEDQELRNSSINVTNNGVNYGGSQFSGNLTIEDCTIYGGNVGVNLDPDPFLRGDIRRNSIRGGSRSMSVSGTSNQNLRIYNNFILASPLTSLRILTSGLNGPTVLHNSIVGGVVLDGTAGFTFVNNAVVAGQGAALVVDSPVAFDPTEWNVSNNAYYRSSPGNIVVYSINNGQDITTLDAIFQTFGLESASMVANPYFFSPDDLHANAPELNNTGVYRSEVPDDIDLQERSTSTPDIGADEFDVQWASGDIVVQEVVIPESICPGAFPVNVVVQNNSDGMLTYLQVEISVNGVALPLGFWQGELPAGVSDTLEVGSIALEAGGTYVLDVVAEPSSAFFSDDALTNTTPSVVLQTGLAGTVTVGEGGMVPSLQAFQEAVNDNRVCGDVSLLLLSSVTDAAQCIYTGSDPVDLTISATEGVVVAAPLDVQNWSNIYIDSLLFEGFDAIIAANAHVFATVVADHASFDFQAQEVNVTNSQLDSSHVSIACEHVVFSNNTVSGYDAVYGNTGVEIALNGSATGQVTSNLFVGGNAPLSVANADSLDCVNNRFLHFETNALTLDNSSVRVVFNTFYSSQPASVSLVATDSEVTGVNNIMHTALILSTDGVLPQLNYNVYFASEENPFSHGAEVFSDLASWQTFTGGDANSSWLDAEINDALSAEFSNAALNGAGIYYPEYPMDAIGRVRSNPPAPGAMESNPQPPAVNGTLKNLEVTALIVQAPAVGSNDVSVSLTLNDAFLPAVQGLVYQGAVDSVLMTLSIDGEEIHSSWWSGTLDFGDTLTITLEDVWQIPLGKDYALTCNAALSPLYAEVNYADNESDQHIVLPMQGLYTVAVGTDPVFVSLDEAHASLVLCGMSGGVELLIGETNALISENYTSDDSHTLSYQGSGSATSLSFADGLDLENVVFQNIVFDSAMHAGRLRSVAFDQCSFQQDMDGAVIEEISDVVMTSCTIQPLSGGFVIENIGSDNAHSEISSTMMDNGAAGFEVHASQSAGGTLHLRSNTITGDSGISISLPFGIDSLLIEGNEMHSDALALQVALAAFGTAHIWNNIFTTTGSDALEVLAGSESEVLMAFNNFLGRASFEGEARWNVVNNVFAGNASVVTATLPSWTTGTDSWDYNAVWSYGSTTSVGQWTVNGEAYTTLVTLRQATGMEVNSWQVDPLYLNTTSLQPGNSVLAGHGVTIESINNDVTGVIRSVPPSIGAYEIMEGGMHTDVWPGDANDDFEVNLFDALPIIFHHGTTGSSRESASIEWNGQPSADWPMVSFSGDNLKWADTNGDGMVTQADTLAIVQNTGQLRANGYVELAQLASVDGSLSLIADQAEWVAGEWVTMRLVLAVAEPEAENMRALAARIQVPLDIVVQDSVEWTAEGTDFPASPTFMRMQSYDVGTGIAEVTIGSLTDAMSLNGIIATLRFRLREDISSETIAEVTIVQHELVNVSGEVETIVTENAEVTVLTIGINDKAVASDWRIFPNPSLFDPMLVSKGFVGAITHVRVIGFDGRVVWEQTDNRYLGENGMMVLEGVSNLPAACYSVEVLSANGQRTVLRWVKL